MAERTSRSEARGLLDASATLAARVQVGPAALGESTRNVVGSFESIRKEMVSRELHTIPVGRLRDVTSGSLRVGAIESCYSTVGQLVGVSEYHLQTIPGVGPATARQVVAAVHALARTVEEGFRLRIDLDPANSLSTALLRSIHTYDRVEKAVAPVGRHLTRATAEIASLRLQAAPAGHGWLRRAFTGASKKEAAQVALVQLPSWLAWAESPDVATALHGIDVTVRAPTVSAAEAWRDFEVRSLEYYGALGQVVDLKRDVPASEGFLPAEIVAQVNAQVLTRRYCEWGYVAISPSEPVSRSSSAGS